MRLTFLSGLRAPCLSLCVLLPMAVSAADTPVLVRGPEFTVTGDDIKASVQLIPKASRPAVLTRPQNIQRQAEDLYLRRVLAAEAEKAGLDKNPLVQALIRQARERILSDAQITELALAALPTDAVAAAQARDLYRANPERFRTAAQTRARHILVAKAPDARQRAEALLARVKAGESFEALARAESADLTTAASGGDLGWFVDGAMVPEFHSALDALKNPGDLSGIVETSFGLHIVRLEGRRAAGIRAFDEVREALENEVRADAQQQARSDKLRQVMGAAQIDPAVLQGFARANAPRLP